MSARSIDTQQQQAIATALRLTGPRQVRFSLVGDDEANLYARQIGAAFEIAGVQLDVTSAGITMPPITGVLVGGPHAQQLAHALKAGRVESVDTGHAGDDRVFVGLKPPLR